MELSMEDRQNSILKIASTVDFGLGSPQSVIDVHALPPQRKQEVCLFRFDSPNSPRFAYRLIKSGRKLKEYPACMQYNADDIGYPAIRYFNAPSREVVTDWVEGERLAYFDRPKRLQPKVGIDELAEVLSRLVRLHQHTLDYFSNVEFVPRTHLLTYNDQLFLPPTYYPQRLMESYVIVYESIERAKNKTIISTREYQLVRDMTDYVQKVLEGSQNIFTNFGNFSLLHGDVHTENVIKTPQGKRLIDFENLHYGDRAVEIAYFLEHCSQAGFINQDNVNLLVEKYLEMLAKDHSNVSDNSFKDRLRILRAYLTTKLLGMLSGGYTAEDQNMLNRTLFEDVLSRNRIILASI